MELPDVVLLHGLYHQPAHMQPLAAFVLDLGESCAALSGPRAPVNAWARPHPSGGTFIPADAAQELFYGDCDPVASSLAIGLLTRQEPGHGRGIATRAAWRELPSKYIVCADDRAVEPALQKRLALRCTDSDTISTSHSPYISQPVLIADAILRRPDVVRT